MQPKFELSEPNINSAVRKNNAGLCAIDKCENKLSNPPSYGFLGVKICDECSAKTNDGLKELQKEMDISRWEWMSAGTSKLFFKEEK